MNISDELKNKYNIIPLSENLKQKDEIYITVQPKDFIPACLAVHKSYKSPVMLMFAEDKREEKNCYRINTAFYSIEERYWAYICLDLSEFNPVFPSLGKEIYSAIKFEREIFEMFGITPQESPDLRRLRLHDEVWPEKSFPLRKDFTTAQQNQPTGKSFNFIKGEGIGLFEVPVGPVHAGIIGPGHFRFSVAGEPIINLEIRLGFTHRGVEKLLEGKTLEEGLKLSECVSGDSAFAHSLAFCTAIEKIKGISPTRRAQFLRGIYLELERMYNHANDIGGMALDVGFSFASSFASVIKEIILQLNQNLCGNRYLKGINTLGGVKQNIDQTKEKDILNTLDNLSRDIKEIEKILFSSASLLDRLDPTGVLEKNIAKDLGIVGLSARASGINIDFRSKLEPYQSAGFSPIVLKTGDALARLNIRIMEFKQSISLIREFIKMLGPEEIIKTESAPVELYGLGTSEGWRGPVLYWIRIDSEEKIERCKIVDPSFCNWIGLSYAAQGEIIPDFPLCNKSFDLSYSGSDL